jgi:hypothetical protein
MDTPKKSSFCISLLLLVAFAAGCATADHGNKRFAKSQQLRHDALLAANRGDTAQALNYLDQVRVLEPRPTGASGRTPPYLSHPEHSGISPGWGESTCNNTGINQFYCF